MKPIKYLSILLLLASGLVSNAQKEWKKPNYKQIEKNCQEQGSLFFYDALFQRYLKGDSSFSQEEQQHLYYGYQFKTDYSPYGNSDYKDSLRDLLSKDKPDEQGLRLALSYCDSVLYKDPMDLRTLNIQAGLCGEINNAGGKAVAIAKMDNIISAILNSGDGLTEATAYYVICVPHEYVMLSVLGLKYGGSQSLKGSNDYLKVEKNNYDIEGLYFNVTASLNSMDKLFEK